MAINQAGDSFEEEADRVADQVMRTPEVVQTKRVQPSDTGPIGPPPIIDEVLRSSGRPLDPATRAFMEPRFGHDFSKVRVHTGERASASASAIQALAYTLGENLVFAAGQYRPDTTGGKQLIAHELAHVLQRGPRQGLIYRKATQQDEDKKKVAVATHQDQQKLVIQFLGNAKKITPDPKRGLQDPDNLYHNTAELVELGKTALKVLTPTHYSQTNDPVYFDYRVAHPTIGGDYPADPALPPDPMLGLVKPPGPGVTGQTQLPAPAVQFTPTKTPKGEEHSPGRVDPTYHPEKPEPKGTEAPPPSKTPAPAKPSTPAAIVWSSAEILLFINFPPINEADFRNTIVHEGQHVADWSFLNQPTQKSLQSGDWKAALELYKSEFRAYWIEPPTPSHGSFLSPNPIPASVKQNPVTIASGLGCSACGGSGGAAGGAGSASRVPQMKNDRQEQIFWKLIREYTRDLFDCFFVCNKDFADAVNAYDQPVGINVVNSTRLIELTDELRNVTKGMKRDQVSGTKLLPLIGNLDAIDWAFLKDDKLSAPFWKSVEGSTPKPIAEALHALAKKGAPSHDDVTKRLDKALGKVKR